MPRTAGPFVAVQHAPHNAMDDPREIERFHDRCSDLMRELLDGLAAAPDRPRPFPEIEDAIGWPHRRIASVLGGASRMRHREFGGRRPYRFLGPRESASGRWEMWMDDLQARAVVEAVLGEQKDYYRAVAAEYGDHAILFGDAGLPVVVDTFRPAGRVLELACGPGAWTPQLLRHADSVTAVDASAEMLAIAADQVTDKRVRFIHADLFAWEPDGRYDVVFFGFWLSHVPLERFEAFWSLVGRCLQPHGRVLFVDDAYRPPDELVYGESSHFVRRRLNDGTAFRILKLPHTPAELERRLKELGWQVEVRSAEAPFFWGAGYFQTRT